MSKRLVKDWLEGYLRLTEESEPPRLFRLWTGISIIAAALQRKCRLERGTLTFYPNMYIVLVGPPATRKGTAMGQGYYFLSELGISTAADSCTREALIKRLKSMNKKKLNMKTGEQLVHSSLTIYSEEFTVLIGYKDIDFLTILTNWYDCGRGPQGFWERETISHELERVAGVWVNVLGASTPTLLRSALPTETIGSGFASRIILVNEHKKGKSIAVPKFTEEDRKLREKLKKDLEQILDLCGEFTVTPAWDAKWAEWYDSQEEEALRTLDSRTFSDYIGRRASHLYKLNMIVNVSRTNSMQIDVEDFEKAHALLLEVEKNMNDTFASFGRFEYADVMGELVRLLRSKGELLMDEVYRSFGNDADKKTLDMIVETIVAQRVAKRELVGTQFRLTWVGKVCR